MHNWINGYIDGTELELLLEFGASRRTCQEKQRTLLLSVYLEQAPMLRLYCLLFLLVAVCILLFNICVIRSVLTALVFPIFYFSVYVHVVIGWRPEQIQGQACLCPSPKIKKTKFFA